jgi:hypothetical protein
VPLLPSDSKELPRLDPLQIAKVKEFQELNPFYNSRKLFEEPIDYLQRPFAMDQPERFKKVGAVAAGESSANSRMRHDRPSQIEEKVSRPQYSKQLVGQTQWGIGTGEVRTHPGLETSCISRGQGHLSSKETPRLPPSSAKGRQLFLLWHSRK